MIINVPLMFVGVKRRDLSWGVKPSRDHQVRSWNSAEYTFLRARRLAICDLYEFVRVGYLTPRRDVIQLYYQLCTTTGIHSIEISSKDQLATFVPDIIQKNDEGTQHFGTL